MATITLTPDTPSGGTIATIHPSSAYPLMHGARMPVTQHEGTFHESAFTEGRHRIRTNPKNPTGEGRVLVQGTTAALFRTNSDDFQSLIAQTNRYGGTLTYTPTSGTAVSYEIVEINLGEIETDLEHSETRAVFPFTFECRPYGLLASQAISFTGGTLTGPCDYMNLPDVPGHVDALGTLELTDVSTQNHDHIEFGLEMDGYVSTSATDLILSKTDMNATGLAGVSNAGMTGDYTGTVWRGTLFTSPLAVCSTGTQTHQGKRRIRARVAAQGTGSVYVRLAWRIGDGPWERNSWVEVEVGRWSEPSLGSIYVPLGEVWEGRVEAKSETNGDTVDVDVVFPMPAERWGRSSRLVKSQTVLDLSAYDTFLQTAGALAGKVLPLGGTWAGAGDADDFQINATEDRIERSAVSDAAGLTNGRFALAGATDYTTTQVEVGTHVDSTFVGRSQGLVARYVDASNFIVAYVVAHAGGGQICSLYVYKVVAGTETLLGYAPGYVFPNTGWRKLRLTVDVAGQWSLALSGLSATGGGDYGPFSEELSGQDTVLATGGALAAGQAGIFDTAKLATAVTRYYDSFMLSAPPAAETLGAMFSGQSMRFTYEGAERENSAGTRWGAAPNFVGHHLLIPPAGREDRTSRIAILARRYDIDSGQPSDGLSDSLTATLTVIPRVLLTST